MLVEEMWDKLQAKRAVAPLERGERVEVRNNLYSGISAIMDFLGLGRQEFGTTFSITYGKSRDGEG